MAESAAKKIAYLFGAGATHAELENVIPDLVPEQDGLLISHLGGHPKAAMCGHFRTGHIAA